MGAVRGKKKAKKEKGPGERPDSERGKIAPAKSQLGLKLAYLAATRRRDRSEEGLVEENESVEGEELRPATGTLG